LTVGARKLAEIGKELPAAKRLIAVFRIDITKARARDEG
jgi:hypothetical protein